MGHHTIQRTAGLVALLVALAALASGCYAGYAGAVADMHAAIDTGDSNAALEAVNAALKSEEGKEHTPLLLLERAVIQQSLGNHERAVSDFAQADQSMEVLDLSQDDAGTLGKYLFSDDSNIYKAPPHEKILVNTLAMISYLEMGDLEGARVEARRLAVMQKYLEDAAEEELALFGLGSYLAGFAFEQSGMADDALRFYIEAYDKGGYTQLAPKIAVLGAQLGSSFDEVAQARAEAPDAQPIPEGHGEVLVVVQNGRAPYKVAERFPAGAFLSVHVADARWQMSAEQQASADRAIAKGLLKWINFPVLVRSPPGVRRVDVTVDRTQAAPELAMNVEQCTLAAWEYDEGKLRLAAFTRMLTRAVAGTAAEMVGKGSGLDKQLFPGASLLLGAALEGGMAAADTPDTRSWTMLPGDIQIYRMIVPAGEHTIRVRGVGQGGGTRSRKIEVQAGRAAVFNVRFLQ